MVQTQSAAKSGSLKALFFTKYPRTGASSRYRSLQYFEILEGYGITPESVPLFGEEHLARRLRHGRYRVMDAAVAAHRRLWHIAKAHADVAVIEYELLPYFPSLLEKILNLRNIPFIIDYDDAIFHNYDCHTSSVIRRVLGKKIAAVMRAADCVVAGNKYIADYARGAGARRIEIIPTVVDPQRYGLAQPDAARPFTIGWIGSPSTSVYLHEVAGVLRSLHGEGAAVRLVGSGPVELPGLQPDIVAWSEGGEVGALQTFDVGIMPLPDTRWTRGKCGAKLLQYMACGLPTVASPVGINREIVVDSETGFLVESESEWAAALHKLCKDRGLRQQMGAAGRKRVVHTYSLQVTGPVWADLIWETVRASRAK